MNKIELSKVNEEGYYEIRLESVGGLGANLCGKLLGELGAAYLGFNASSFSSYGSEKRGSPVKAFIRYCDEDMTAFLMSFFRYIRQCRLLAPPDTGYRLERNRRLKKLARDRERRERRQRKGDGGKKHDRAEAESGKPVKNDKKGIFKRKKNEKTWQN